MLKNLGVDNMGSESKAREGLSEVVLDDSEVVLRSPPIPHAEPSASDSSVPSQEAVLPANLARATLDQLVADLSTIKLDIAERLQYDKAKEEAFDRLYAQLDELRSDREFDHLKPLYLDLILLFDRLDQTVVAALPHEDTSPARAVLVSLRAELVEVLYRREIELIDPSPPAFDPTLQRAVGTQDTDTPDKHNSVGAVVRRGFRYRGRMLRPEEVILNKCRTHGQS